MPNRSVGFALVAPPELKDRIIASVRDYRAMLRTAYGVVATAQAAAADIVFDQDGERLRVIPNGPRSKAVLEGLFVHGGESFKAFGYELRAAVLAARPNWYSFVWDSLRADLAQEWSRPDPEFPTAKKGYLNLNGVRPLAVFQRRGIQFPQATATSRPRTDTRSVTLKWDKEIGPVRFEFDGEIDPGRMRIWRNLLQGTDGWTPGTFYLTEIDKKFKLTASYGFPDSDIRPDASRVARLVFPQGEGEPFYVLTGPGPGQLDEVDSADAMAFLNYQYARKKALEARREACGNPKRPWGHRKGWLANQDVLSRATLQRERGLTDRNHAMTRRIAGRCAAWGCGLLIVAMPELKWRNHDWPWFQFGQFLRYKCGERNVAVAEPEPA